MTTATTSATAHEIIEKLLAGAGDLPVLPEVAVKVMQELRAPGVGIPRIARMVQQDPALTTAVLRVANSALFGGQSQVSDLTAAMTHIGLTQTRNMIYALVLRSKLADAQAYGSLGPVVFAHSLAVACGSRLVADAAGVDAEDVFLCGLLHDIGKLALAKALRDHAEVKVSVLPAVQLELIETHHADAGALLARRWGLPEHVARVIRYHHEPEAREAPQPGTACVTLANALCHKLDIGGQSVAAIANQAEPAARTLRMTPQDVATLAAQLPAGIERASAPFRP